MSKLTGNRRMEQVSVDIQTYFLWIFCFLLEVYHRGSEPKVMLMGMLIANCPLREKQSISVSLEAATTTTDKKKKLTNLRRISLYDWIECINLHLWQIQRDRDDNKAQTAHIELWFWAVCLPVEAICLFTSIQTRSPRHTIDAIHFSDGGGKLSAFHPTRSTLVMPTPRAKYLWLFGNNSLYWRKTSTE